MSEIRALGGNVFGGNVAAADAPAILDRFVEAAGRRSTRRTSIPHGKRFCPRWGQSQKGGKADHQIGWSACPFPNADARFFDRGCQIDQAAGAYGQMRSGRIDFALYFQRVHDALPLRLQHMLDTSGFATFERAQARISGGH